MEKVVLVDGHNLLFRMFFGIPAPIRNSKGKDIRGLVGFIGSLKKLVDEFKPYSLVVIFDSESSRDNNLEVDSGYKANRVDYSDAIDNPFSQLPLIYKALEYLKIDYLEVFGNEADDYISSLVKRDSYEYIIVSTDSDFIQLVNDEVKLFVPRGKNSILFDEKKVFDKYRVRPKNYILYKSLVGDKSDNVGGINGIGPITASKYVECGIASEKVRLLIAENSERIDKNIKLITMKSDIDTTNFFFHRLGDKIFLMKTYEIIDSIGEK